MAGVAPRRDANNDCARSVTRRYLTPSEMHSMLQRQGGVCAAPTCMSEGPFEADHSTPHAWDSKKPDQLLCVPCHRKKTFGLRGDISTIAKVKRIRDGNTQFDKRAAAGGSRINGGGFKGWRKMDGTVVVK